MHSCRCVHRKGAIPAHSGKPGIISGSKYPAKFNLNYFKREDAKTQSRKDFKLRVFLPLRLGV